VKASQRVVVLGRELQVRTSASAATVTEVAHFIDRTAAQVAGSVASGDTQLIALLTLLNIAEGYLTLQQQVAAGEQRAHDVMSCLVQQIDTALE
jgi:cell division protein ZapA (FtsZ GTPase activity inhibitor)